MSGTLKLHLKSRERVFINGAVLRVDRKATIELLNDAVFLLENHVMQEEQASTPIRQLYFVVQTMLLDPNNIDATIEIYQKMHRSLISSFKNQDILEELVSVRGLVEADRQFPALKKLRALFPLEQEILAPRSATTVRSGESTAVS